MSNASLFLAELQFETLPKKLSDLSLNRFGEFARFRLFQQSNHLRTGGI